METFGLAIFFIGLTVALYFILNILYVRYRWTILTPVLTTTFALVIILVLFHIPYSTYMVGGSWIDKLLGPAVVSLAIPLYKQRELLLQNLIPVAAGVLSGVVVGMSSGIVLAKLFRFSNETILALLPKSITTPVAMQIAGQLGGVPSLAAVFVMISGFSGIVVGPAFLKWLKIDSPIGRGIGLGASAHGLGTAKAFEYGPQEASMSSVAMSLSAVFGSFLGPVFVWIFFL